MATRLVSSVTDPTTGVQEFLSIDALITQSVVDSQGVTRFPVESGFNISDHTFKENRKINLSGVVSKATLKEDQGTVIIRGIDQEIIEESDVPPRSVISVLGAELSNKVPDNILSRNAIKQKNTVKAGDVFHDTLTARSEITTARSFLEKMFKESIFVTLDAEAFDIDNLIITSLTFDKRRPEKEVLNFTMTLEQVRIVNTQNVFVPVNLREEDSKVAEGEVSEGLHTSTTLDETQNKRLLESAFDLVSEATQSLIGKGL